MVTGSDRATEDGGSSQLCLQQGLYPTRIDSAELSQSRELDYGEAIPTEIKKPVLAIPVTVLGICIV